MAGTHRRGARARRRSHAPRTRRMRRGSRAMQRERARTLPVPQLFPTSCRPFRGRYNIARSVERQILRSACLRDEGPSCMFATGSDARGIKVTWYSGRPVACLEENTLFEYLCDRLDVAARDAVAAHAADCESCRRMIAEAALQLTRTNTGDVGGAQGTPRGDAPPRAAVDGRREPALIAEKYRLLRQIGSGGMGTVHEAVNTWTGRRVAVKQLRSAASSDATAAQRFMREARSASRIVHPNVVDILDLGQDPETGALFMVQELLVGTTLRQRLAERGVL